MEAWSCSVEVIKNVQVCWWGEGMGVKGRDDLTTAARSIDVEEAKLVEAMDSLR